MNLAGISEEARKHNRLSQWVQNNWGGVLGDTASSEGPQALAPAETVSHLIPNLGTQEGANRWRANLNICTIWITNGKLGLWREIKIRLSKDH